MDYHKPEIEILGEAKSLITSVNPVKPPVQPFDSTLVRRTLPAYDLDE